LRRSEERMIMIRPLSNFSREYIFYILSDGPERMISTLGYYVRDRGQNGQCDGCDYNMANTDSVLTGLQKREA
jgi:hypothetical protein